MPETAASAQKFIALAVMFQSLMLALLIIGAALVKGSVAGQVFTGSLASSALAVILLLVLISLMLWSYRRYKRMWSQTVCMSFVAWVKLGKNDDGNTP